VNDDLYRTMRLIRRFEERIVDLVNANEIAGVTHEYVGQEGSRPAFVQRFGART